MARDDLHPPIRVKAFATPDHYTERNKSGPRWQEQVIGRVIVVQEYEQASLSHAYHITNCPDNDKIDFFHTRGAYGRKSMTLHKRFFVPVLNNQTAKSALSRLEGE